MTGKFHSLFGSHDEKSQPSAGLKFPISNTSHTIQESHFLQWKVPGNGAPTCRTPRDRARWAAGCRCAARDNCRGIDCDRVPRRGLCSVLWGAWRGWTVKAVKAKAEKLHLFKLGRFLSWFQWKLFLSLLFSWEACPVRKLSCGHSFHHACIAEWLLRRASCPLCKSALGLKIYKILQMGEQGMNSKSHHGFLIYLNRQPGLAYIVAVFALAYFLPVFRTLNVATLGRILDIQ